MLQLEMRPVRDTGRCGCVRTTRTPGLQQRGRWVCVARGWSCCRAQSSPRIERIIQNFRHVSKLVQRNHGVAVDNALDVRVHRFDDLRGHRRRVSVQSTRVSNDGVRVRASLCKCVREMSIAARFSALWPLQLRMRNPPTSHCFASPAPLSMGVNSLIQYSAACAQSKITRPYLHGVARAQ
jgi:hypothetical protein